MALVGEVAALVALARPGSMAPGVLAAPLATVFHELTLVAVAAGPGLHALAVFLSGAELAPVFRRAPRMPCTLGKPVLAGPCVRPLQLRIEHFARLRQRGHRDKRQYGHDERENWGQGRILLGGNNSALTPFLHHGVTRLARRS